MQKTAFFIVLIGTIIGIMMPSGERARSAPEPKAAEGELFDSEPPKETRLDARGNGHFYVHADVNGELVEFMVDTGASFVALTMDDAERLGIPFTTSEFEVVGTGASGPVRGKFIELETVDIDGKKVRSVDGAVVEGLDISLLGQSYLSRIGGIEMGGDYMILR